MKKIIITAAIIGLGLGFAMASTNNFAGRTIHGASPLQAAKMATKNTTTVCYQLCDLNGKCYTECTVTQN